MKVDLYNLKARTFPALLTALPLFALYQYSIIPLFRADLAAIHAYLPTAATVVIWAAFVYFLAQVDRLIAKEIFQRRFFEAETAFPTTDYLLWTHSFFADDFKRKVREKIHLKFGIELAGMDAEKVDEAQARKLISVAVSQVRNCLRENSLLLQRNIEYGFFRNLIGGCVLALLFSLGLFVWSLIVRNNAATALSVSFGILYLLPLVFSKFIMNRLGKYYCTTLYEQFLSWGIEL